MPEMYGTWTSVKHYIEHDPEPGYAHASEGAYEAFRDMKFAVRVHWGLYSINKLQNESWPFLRMDHEQRRAYQELHATWNPAGFDAGEWMAFFTRSGFRCMAFTTKHHEGFSMFDTATRVKKRMNWGAPGGPSIEDCDLAYSIMETPFKRDVVRELCDAARAAGIKIDLYFSHPDWHDADFRPYSHHPLLTGEALENPHDFDADLLSVFIGRRYEMVDPPSPAERQRAMQRHRDQLLEILGNYGKIDTCCLDMRFGPGTWPFLKETIKMARALQPDVMFRCRGIGNYGDYYTPEGYVPGDPANTAMPWMVIYPLGRSFSHEPEAANHKGTAWIVHNLVDTCAKGGNFMVGIGPDGDGRFHPEAIAQCEAAGAWLEVNGEGIYATRPWAKAWREGEHVRFTASKDQRRVHAFTLEWPGEVFRSSILQPAPGSEVRMLGVDAPLPWVARGDGFEVSIPATIAAARPCDHAWCFTVHA